VGVVQHKYSREEAPHHSQIPIKANYLLKLNPRTSRNRLRIISMILFGVPVLLVISLPVLDVLIIVFLVGLLIEIILCPILLIQLFEAFATHQMFTGAALLPVMLVSVQEILIVLVVLQAVTDPFLLVSQRVSHLATTI
jgi:hypothetical protein